MPIRNGPPPSLTIFSEMKFHAALNPTHTSSAAARNPQKPRRLPEDGADRAETPVGLDVLRLVADDRRAPREHDQAGDGVDRHRPLDARHLQDRAEHQAPERVRRAHPPAEPAVVGHRLVAQVHERDRVDVRAGRHPERRDDRRRRS